MNELARQAGMSRAALNQLFSTKEEILLRLFSDLLAGLIGEIRRGVASLPAGPDRLVLAFGLEFSRDVFERFFREFEDLLTTLLPAGTKVPAPNRGR